MCDRGFVARNCKEAFMEIARTKNQESPRDLAVDRVNRLVAWYRSNIGDTQADDQNYTVLTDLLADLRHWADAEDMYFAVCDRWAEKYYLSEFKEVGT